jgi:hypothetical protein
MPAALAHAVRSRYSSLLAPGAKVSSTECADLLRHISSEYFFVLGMLAAYAIAGGFAILPFRRSLRFGILAAPFAGLLCVTLGIAVFYSIAGFTAERAAYISFGGCILTTIIGLAITRPKIPWRDIPGLLVAVLVIAPTITRIVDVASIREHGPALHFADATDQIGYAQAADWLRTHSVAFHPQARPESPTDAWLTVLFQIDPRFGCHFFLATISMIRGVSGTFSYDVACAVCLVAALLAVAGVFARSWNSLVLLLLGLLVCHWYEDSRLGYLGKLLAYPAGLFVAGLFMALPRRITVESILVLALLASSAAIMHSGTATALFLITIGGPYLLARIILIPRGQRRTELESSWHASVILALLVGTAIMTSGLPARPTPPSLPDFGVKWIYIFPRSLDLEHQGANIGNNPIDGLPPLAFGREDKLVSGLSAKAVRRLAKVASGLWICLVVLALVRREPVAIGLLLGPLALLVALYLADKRPEAFQLVGVVYPATMCGAARLLNWPAAGDRRRLAQFSLVATIIVAVFIGLRIPRFAGSVRRYAGAGRPRSQEFSLRQTNRIVKAVGSQPVELNILSLPHLLFAIVEMGNQGVHFQFTQQSFYSAFAYMPWQTPPYPPPQLRLMLMTDDRPPGWRVKMRAAPFMLLVPEQ